MAANVSVTYNFVAGTPAVADDVDTNFSDLVSWINTNAVHLDASKAFTSIPSGPASDPTTGNQFTRKAYVDARYTICTSSTRPASPVDGSMIYETDKNRVRVYNGSGWDLAAGSCGAVATGSHTVANTVTSTLSFATEVSDTDSVFTAGGNTFTVPDDGMYAVTYNFVRSSGTNFSDGFGSSLEVVTTTRSFKQGFNSLNDYSGTFIVPLSATNTVQFKFTNITGNSTSFTSWVSVRRVGA